MNIGISPQKGLYVVEIYTAIRSEQYPTWHPCRKFENLGDAILFKEYCIMHKIDPARFAATYNPDAVCTFFQFRNGSPKLTMKHENRNS